MGQTVTMAQGDALRRSLLQESGISEVSTENVRQLLGKLGKPSIVIGRNVRVNDVDEMTVEFVWPGFSHACDGFGWGYAGTGPAHLADLFDTLGIAFSIDIARIPRDIRPGKTEHKVFEYHLNDDGFCDGFVEYKPRHGVPVVATHSA